MKYKKLSEEDKIIRGVMQTYDEIAFHFSQTRDSPWPDVVEFLENLSGKVGLDICCGNGRHSELLSKCAEKVIGMDLSSMMLRETVQRGVGKNFEVIAVKGNSIRLPIKSECVDIGVYIAAIHHLPTSEYRVDSLNELERVLSPDGIAIIGAWCTEHDRFERGDGFDTIINWKLPNGDLIPRYYHIYDMEEFEKEIKCSKLNVIETYVSRGNCYAIVGGS